MTNYKKVEGSAIIIQGICDDIITETEVISDDAHELVRKRNTDTENTDIIKSFKKIGNYIEELQKYYDFLQDELKSEIEGQNTK